MFLTLLGIQFAHLLAVMSPGPSFVVVTRVAVAHSRAEGVWTAFGFSLGTLIYGVAAILGLHSLFVALPMLYAGVRVVAAAYLFWLAFMFWRHAADPLPDTATETAIRAAPLGAIRRGLITQLSNPKVVVFMGSIFVTLLPANPSPVVIALLLAIVWTNEFAWFGLVACVASMPRPRRAYTRAKSYIDRLTGAVLAGLGLKLALAP